MWSLCCCASGGVLEDERALVLVKLPGFGETNLQEGRLRVHSLGAEQLLFLFTSQCLHTRRQVATFV